MGSPVITIDCNYLRPRFAASYLLVEEGRAAFVENNTAHSVPLLLRALRDAGLSPEQVEYLIVTHVHLDHAGGSQALMDACPNARLLAHPRAVRHLIDPSRLVSSAKAVYGEEEFERLYGRIGPIPAERVREMKDGEEIAFGGRRLRFLHTRGHANHHFCVMDTGSRGIFTGDSFGLAYPDLQRGGLFIFPSTSPTDFDPAEAKATLDRVLATGAERAYLTHFGEIRDLKGAAMQLRAFLDFSEGLLKEAIGLDLAGRDLAEACEGRLRARFKELLKQRGLEKDESVWELLRLDLELNAAGIAYAAEKARASAAPGSAAP